MKRNFKLLFMVVIMATFICSSLGVTAFAEAKVGDQLTQPEDGWKRYDDRDKDIQHIYYGGWTDGSAPGCYAGRIKFVYENENKEDKKVKFNFIGSKLRIISVGWEIYSHATTIKIDNKIIENYSSGTGGNLQTLAYEKLDLVFCQDKG